MSIKVPRTADPAQVGVPVYDPGLRPLPRHGVECTTLPQQGPQWSGRYLEHVAQWGRGVAGVWEAGRWFATGEVGGRLGSAHQTQAPYQAVRTADGFVTLGAITPKTWAGLCTALGLDDLRSEERYADAFGRHAHRDEVVAAIEAVTTTLSTRVVVEALDEEGVPCAPLVDYADVFTDEHLHARDYFWDADHPVLGRVAQLDRRCASPVHRCGAAARVPTSEQTRVRRSAHRATRPTRSTTSSARTSS